MNNSDKVKVFKIKGSLHGFFGLLKFFLSAFLLVPNLTNQLTELSKIRLELVIIILIALVSVIILHIIYCLKCCQLLYYQNIDYNLTPAEIINNHKNIYLNIIVLILKFLGILGKISLIVLFILIWISNKTTEIEIKLILITELHSLYRLL